MIRSSLSRHVPRSPASPEEIEGLNRRAWHKDGAVVIRPEEITDEWLRLRLVAWATERYGRRAGKCP